jgi:hypothetical protein
VIQNTSDRDSGALFIPMVMSAMQQMMVVITTFSNEIIALTNELKQEREQRVRAEIARDEQGAETQHWYEKYLLLESKQASD